MTFNWAEAYRRKYKLKNFKEKDWNKAAPTFHERAIRDDYKECFFSKLELSKEDTVLDLGCGEGTLSLELAKKVKHITGLDSSEKMLELFNKNAEKQNITNADTILKPIEEISYEELGDYDVVIASRSLNTIQPIEIVLNEMDKIANKAVYFTYFGPDNWKIEREFYKYINKEYNEFPSYNYIFNILYDIGIYPNTERLNIKLYREYIDIKEAMKKGKFRLDTFNDVEKEQLEQFLTKIMKKDEKTGKIYNEMDKADWILFYWRK